VTALWILLALLALGLPIAFALGFLGLAMLVLGGFSPLMVPQALLSTVDSFILLAVPLFLLMGNILLRGGVGRDLFDAVQAWVGHWPGGLAVATVVSCALFSAISGSSVATAATIGTVAIPEMIARGYERRFVLGLLAAGGTLGILIPPSIPMIVYGVVTEESIVSLFLAGILPGLLLAGLFALYAMLHAAFGGGYTPSPKADAARRREASLRVLPTVALAAVVVGGLYAGAFTPTEAAAVGFAGALVLTGPVLRRLDRATLWLAVRDSMVTTVTIFLILAGAKVFAKAITLYRIPQDLSAVLIQTFDTAGPFVAAVALVLLFMGCFLEALSMLVLMMPVLHPALLPLGIDPIWFGVFFVVMIECALITPPVGLDLFVIQAVAKTGVAEVAYGVWPFILIMLFTVFLLWLVPGLALWIPFGL
jgi:C4-dicarboxylate transporter DctM subunit